MSGACGRCGGALDARGACPRCASGLPDDPTAKARTLGSVELLRPLRGGTHGSFYYQGRYRKRDGTVMVKLLEGEAASREAVARLAREAQVLGLLNHANIVRVYAVEQHESTRSLVLEFVEGLSLREMLASRPLEPEQTVAVVGQLCDALEYMHGHNVVHRDLRPDTVLLDSADRVKIADFGWARRMGSPRASVETEGKLIVGTTGYAAPEMYKYPDVDHRADVYALGVTLHELLTGRIPREGAAPDPRVAAVVRKATAANPDERYQRAEELMVALKRVLR